MLHSMKDIRDFQVVAPDGVLGVIDDFLFDPRDWRIVHLLARTGGWATTRKLSIAPQSITSIDWEEESIRIESGSDQSAQQPASFDQANYAAWRQHDAEFERRYGHASHWNLPYLWDESALPDPLSPPAQAAWAEAQQSESVQQDASLRSGREVAAYAIRTTDSTIGHVEDFLFEDRGWTIPMLVVETREWWPGKHVLIATARIDYLDREDRCIAVRASREELENNPDFDLMSANPEGAVQDLYRRFWRAPHSR